MDVAHDSRWYARRALVAYLVTIAITRGITTVLHLRGAGADGDVIIDGIHIHHMVFGLTILVILTFGELLILGARRPLPAGP